MTHFINRFQPLAVVVHQTLVSYAFWSSTYGKWIFRLCHFQNELNLLHLIESYFLPLPCKGALLGFFLHADTAEPKAIFLSLPKRGTFAIFSSISLWFTA